MKMFEIINDARILVSETFSLAETEISADSQIYDFPEWDSLGQLKLALALESEYGIPVKDARTFARMTSVTAIASVLCADRADKVDIKNVGGGPDIPGSFYNAGDCNATLVLVHGISSSRHEWGFYDLVALEALENRIAVLAIDSQAHGESRVPIEDLSMQGMVDEIVSAHSWLQSQLPKAGFSMIMGNSLGGGTALMAGYEAGVDLVAMSCAVTSYVADIQRTIPGIAPPIGDTIAYSQLSLPGRIYAEMVSFDDQLKRLNPEFLVQFFHGADDTDVPFDEAKNFADGLSNAKFTAFSGMDHTYTAPINAKQRDEKTVRCREIAAKRIVEELRKHVDDAP